MSNIEEELALFMQAIPPDIERGKPYEWDCPACGGTVRGARNEYNGHLWCKCTKCGKSLME